MSVDRYHRQSLLARVGVEGQKRLARSHALVVGLGALGGTIAEQLVRAGVGRVRIVDRDVVEFTNLQRQVLFDESDVREGIPKAVAAKRRLMAINSDVVIDAHVRDVNSFNVEELAGVGSDGVVNLILDGTDNVATRYLLNDVSVKHGIPWVYGACVATSGRVMAVRPGHSPCLRCLFEQPPAVGELPTCDTAGVLGPAAAVVAAMQAALAIRFLAGDVTVFDGGLLTLDLWPMRFKIVSTADARREDCPTCGQRRFEFLDRRDSQSMVALCGRNSVQISAPVGAMKLDKTDMISRLSEVGKVEDSPYLIRCKLTEEAGLDLTLFLDGRMIVHGTNDLSRARSIYSRYVGI